MLLIPAVLTLELRSDLLLFPLYHLGAIRGRDIPQPKGINLRGGGDVTDLQGWGEGLGEVTDLGRVALGV